MKPSGNESLHRPDHEAICDRNFSATLPPIEAHKVRIMTSQRYAGIPFLGTVKPSANERLHCTDYEIICDRNFFDCFTPGESPQSLSDDVTAKISS